MTTADHITNLGNLFALLERSGLKLVHAIIGHCWKRDEVQGCDEKLVEIGFPCSAKVGMCHNLLWTRTFPSKYPLRAQALRPQAQEGM